MPRTQDRFKLQEALGLKLRELRRRAGLTQADLAKLMGRKGRGGHSLVGRLERGDMPNAGLGLVADYLRACDAGFDDIIGPLREYTSRPNVIVQAGDVAVKQVVATMPAKVAAEVVRKDRAELREAEDAKRLPPSPEARAARARGAAVRAWWRKRIRHRVTEMWNARHWRYGLLVEEEVKAYAVGVWDLLVRTRDRDPATRRAMLDAALGRMLAGTGIDPECVRAAHEEVTGTYDAAIAAGGLAAVAAAPGPLVMRGRGPTPMHAAEREVRIARRNRFVELARDDITRLLEDAGVEPDRMEAWLGVMRSLCTIADSTKPGSTARQQQVDEMADAEPYSKLWRKPALVRRLADIVLPLWDRQSDPPADAK